MALFHRLIYAAMIGAWVACPFAKGAYSNTGKQWMSDRPPGVLTDMLGAGLLALPFLRRRDRLPPAGELALVFFGLMWMHQDCC